MGKKKRFVWRDQLASFALLASLLLCWSMVESIWERLVSSSLILAMVTLDMAAVWRRWRKAEIELAVRRKLPYGRSATITLIAGEDLRVGDLVVINDNGFAVRPSRPYPPPASLTWVRGFVGDDHDA